MKRDKFIEDNGNLSCYVAKFENEHGEQFILYMPVGCTTILITGDELDWEVENLMGLHTFIWSDLELELLSKAITKLLKDKMHGKATILKKH